MGGNLLERQSINCAQCRCMCAIPKWMYSTVSENVSSFKSMINKEDIIANLREVYDPEISINVFDLGLIYGIDIDEDAKWVKITATLTSAFCPFADEIVSSMTKAGYVENVLNVEVEITFDPPFTVESVPEETRIMMGW